MADGDDGPTHWETTTSSGISLQLQPRNDIRDDILEHGQLELILVKAGYITAISLR